MKKNVHAYEKKHNLHTKKKTHMQMKKKKLQTKKKTLMQTLLQMKKKNGHADEKNTHQKNSITRHFNVLDCFFFFF